MSVSLVEVMVAASQRLAPLSGECAGHAVLAAADQLLTHPRLLGAADVLIEENGSVRLGQGRAGDAQACDAALRELLDQLLGVAHSGGAGLLRVGRRAATGDLEQLVKELEVALIPANRAAARRSLARLYRETSRAREAGSLSDAPWPLLQRRAASAPEPVAPEPVAPEPVAPEPVAPVVAVAPESATGEPLGVTEVRWATSRVAPPCSPPADVPVAMVDPIGEDLALEVEFELEVDVTPTPALARHTQPLPEVAPRALHETVPLPPVSPKPMPTNEHETPLEPVLSRRHAGLPGAGGRAPARRDLADIHQTPYLGTLVSPVPVHDDRPLQAWPVPERAPAADTSALAQEVAECEVDESTTDPAPVVAWSEADEQELAEQLPACPALAVEPRVVPLAPKEPRVFRPSDVEELVERFQTAEPDPDPHLLRGLKQLAGITATPPPVRARMAVPAESNAARSSFEASEPSSPIRPIPTVRIAGS